MPAKNLNVLCKEFLIRWSTSKDLKYILLLISRNRCSAMVSCPKGAKVIDAKPKPIPWLFVTYGCHLSQILEAYGTHQAVI